MKRISAIVLACIIALTLASAAFAAAGTRMVTCVNDIAKAIAAMDTNVAFTVEATVTYHPQGAQRPIMGIADDTGTATLTGFINNNFAIIFSTHY